MPIRTLLPLGMLLAAAGAIFAIVRTGQLPPADFVFNNESDIKSIDPAVVTGQPEGRIVDSLYEGLVRMDPKERRPMPGVAKSWDISPDGKTYTFLLRDDAKWSNGRPVVADDFIFSMQRFLSPQTASQYAYQGWYMVGARKYSRGAAGLKVGDAVEVELLSRPKDARPLARGELLIGKLTGIEVDDVPKEVANDPEQYTQHRTFVVEVDGKSRRFRIGADVTDNSEAESCKALLLDFREVGMKAIDDHTIETVLNDPTPFWLELLGFYPLMPVCRECVESHADWTLPENIVGNGPYALEFWRRRDRIRLRKNPHYWDRDNVALEVIDALAVESIFTAFNLYETHQCDWTTKVPPTVTRELLKADPPRTDLNPASQFGTYYYLVNTTRKPLSDVRVRRALALALNRAEVIAAACAGESASRSLVPKGLPNYVPPECVETDAIAAAKLLAEAGFSSGEGFPKLEILYNSEAGHQLIAEIIRKQWERALGINVSTRNEEWASCLNSQQNLDYDVSRKSWIGDYLDPNTFLDMFVTGGTNNNTGWSNAEYDKLIEGAKVEVDPAKRLTMLHRAEEIIMAELPVIPIYTYVSRNIVRPHVKGFYNNLRDEHPLWALSVER